MSRRRGGALAESVRWRLSDVCGEIGEAQAQGEVETRLQVIADGKVERRAGIRGAVGAGPQGH